MTTNYDVIDQLFAAQVACNESEATPPIPRARVSNMRSGWRSLDNPTPTLPSREGEGNGGKRTKRKKNQKRIKRKSVVVETILCYTLPPPILRRYEF